MAGNFSSDSSIKPLQTDLSILDRSLLLETLSSPAIVYSRSEDKILSFNQRFLKISSYSSENLLGASLGEIIPGELDTNPTGAESRSIRLRIASGDLVISNLNIYSLSLTNQIVTLLFSPPEAEFEIRKDLLDRELAYDNMSLLTTVGNQLTLADAFQSAASIVKKVVGSSAVAVYKPDRSGKSLVQIQLLAELGSDQFPGKINPALLEEFPSLHLWRSTRKPECDLHELAIVKGFSYVLTMPLNFNGQLQGLILAAGLSPIPNEEALHYLALLCSHTAAAIHHLSGLENARKTLYNVRQAVQIEHAITDNLEEGIIILTPDLLVAEMNPSAEIMLGYASNEVFLQKVDMVLIGNVSLSTLYKSAQQGISTQSGHDLSLNTRNGKSFLAQMICIPVKTDEKLTSILLIIRDLSQTEQIRARTQQLEQRAFLGEVSAIFAHEVKNPINSISTGLQYIGMTMEKDDPHADLINRLQNDCLRLTHLMDSTLTFSKPIEYHFSPLDLSELIPSILERWGPRMTRLNIRYNFDSRPQHARVKADSRALEQVFVNLISNAIQAMDAEGGSLNIKIHPAKTTAEPPQYEIIVADSGPGIPDEIKDHVFEPFITTNTNGTGLGLAITKRIVTAHKGNIYLESFPGGTMFHILLPRAE